MNSDTVAVPALARRVCKARRTTTCPACHADIVPGQYIAQCFGRQWFHVGCFVGHKHKISTGKERP